MIHSSVLSKLQREIIPDATKMATIFFQKCSLCLATVKHCRLLQPRVSRYYQTSHGDDIQTADVVIAGGGMVGSAMACALGHESSLQNKRIVLLEAVPKKELILSESFGNRTCTLSLATVQLLEKCGIWSEIEGMRCQQVLGMQIWESCTNSLITFNQENMEKLAYVAENDVVVEALTRQLDTLADRVEVMYSTRVENIKIPGVNKEMDSNTWVEVSLDNGQTLKTKLLIGSDGMNSMVRKAANIHTVSFSYNQTGLVAVLNILGTDNNVAWQRFLPTGPIAMLPLADTVLNLIWTTSPDDAKHLLSLSDESFVDAVNDAFWHERDLNEIAEKATEVFESLLQTVVQDKNGRNCVRQLPPTVTGVQRGSRACFPLGLTHASNYVRHRVALIGDAAHRLHPLAGQGVNLGFGDVRKLTEIVAKAAQDGSDLGTLSYLKEYETSRQRKVLPVMGTIDGLQRLYHTDFTPIVLLRSLGLQAVNALTPLKDKIIEQASKK